MDFIYTEEPQIHVQRHKEILKKYPEVKELYGPYFPTFFWILFLVIGQFIIAWFLREQAWWAILGVSYLVGAFFNHALFVMIHECTHNLVFKSPFWNKVMGLVCDFVLILPSALGFRKYHMIHHRHLGEYKMDPDVVSRFEGNLVKNSPIRKALWLSLFSISQALRPMKMPHVPLWNRWIVANLVIQTAVNVAIVYFMGVSAFIYLVLSTLFALGLHPLGGRWIQEHYVTKEGQETYSYYGPLNLLTFNMGYHNEHHDFMHIPWVRLPKLKAIASEYYDSLDSYQSWTKILLRFIFDKEMHSFSRIVHPCTLKEETQTN